MAIKTKSKVAPSPKQLWRVGDKSQKSKVKGKELINPATIFDEARERIFADPISIVFGVLAIVLVGLGIFLAIPKEEGTSIRVIEEEKVESGEVIVDVSGAVLKPGIYKLSSGARVSDAISAAGGFAQNADSDFVSKGINLAQKVSDGAKIYIPKKGEAVQSFSSGESGVSSALVGGNININTASQAQLESLPGIGPVTAGKIIAGRPYSSVDDLLTKKILGQKTFEKIKGEISVF